MCLLDLPAESSARPEEKSTKAVKVWPVFQDKEAVSPGQALLTSCRSASCLKARTAHSRGGLTVLYPTNTGQIEVCLLGLNERLEGCYSLGPGASSVFALRHLQVAYAGAAYFPWLVPEASTYSRGPAEQQGRCTASPVFSCLEITRSWPSTPWLSPAPAAGRSRDISPFLWGSCPQRSTGKLPGPV